MLTVGPVLEVNSSIVTGVSCSVQAGVSGVTPAIWKSDVIKYFVTIIVHLPGEFDELDGVSLGDWSGEGDPRGLGVLSGVPLRVGLQGSAPLRVELPGSVAKLEGLPRFTGPYKSS